MKKAILMLGVVSFLFSCEKKELISKRDSSKGEESINYNLKSINGCSSCVDNDTVTYYLDGEVVEPGSYDPLDTALFTIVEGDSAEAYVNFKAFSNVESYYQYGKQKGFGNKLYLMDKFVNSVHIYIDNSGAANQYDSLGYVDEYHLNKIQEIYNEYANEVIRAPLTIYKDTSGGSSSFLSSGWAAYLLGSWNNEVSRHFHLALWGIVHVYDKAFFRKRFPVFIGDWGWKYIKYTKKFGLSGINDKATSVLAF